jgi:hypothetical protein
VGTVAQEEIDKITTPPNKKAISVDLIILNLLLMETF